MLVLMMPLGFAMPAYATDSPTASEVVAVDTDLEALPDGEQLQEEVRELVQAIVLLRDVEERAARATAIAAAVAVVLKLLLSLLKLSAPLFRRRHVPRLIALGLGLAIYLASSLGLGLPIWEAVILAAGGPGSILGHELLKLFDARPDPEPSPAAG